MFCFLESLNGFECLRFIPCTWRCGAAESLLSGPSQGDKYVALEEFKKAVPLLQAPARDSRVEPDRFQAWLSPTKFHESGMG